jgi:hypothetical protein
MRRILLALQLVGVIASTALASRTITSEEISEAGVTRLAEVLTLVDGWALNTTDGYTWRASPNGLSSFQNQRWIVMVDGQVFDIGAFDAINLNLLPLSLDQIEFVTVESEPGFVQGEYAGNGVVHFRTIGGFARRNGWWGMGYAMGGNETGDPGPYRYTSLKTDNVDAIGPDLGATIGYGGRRWYAVSHSNVMVHYFTDPALLQRSKDVLGLSDPDREDPDTGFEDLFFDASWPGMRQISTSLRLGYNGLGGTHRGLIAYSNARKYLHYADTFGRDIPADHRSVHVGISSEFERQRGINLRYRSQYSFAGLSQHPGTHVDYGWRQHRSRSRVEMSYLNSSRMLPMAGLGLDHVWAEANSPLKDNTVLVVPLYGELYFCADRLSQRVGAMVSFTNESKADKIYATGYYNYNDTDWLGYSVSLAERVPDEDESLWFWTERGYALLDSNGVDYEIAGDLRTSRQTTADITWSMRHSPRLTTTLSANYRHYEDLTVERRDFTLDPSNCAFTGPVEAVTGQGGHVAGGWLRVETEVAPRLRATLRYHYQSAVDAEPALEDAWRAVPEHRASLQLTTTGRAGLTAWLGLTWQSTTDWPDYTRADGATCRSGGTTVTYHSRVDGFLTVDAKVRKLLWSRRASLDVLARNVFADTVRYHPAGASFDLSFFAQLRVRVP